MNLKESKKWYWGGLKKERKDKNDVSRERKNERKKRRKERKDHTITSANSYSCFVLLVH